MATFQDIKAQRFVDTAEDFDFILGTVTKHQPGRHNQKTHAGGMSSNWAKGQWHTLSDKEWVDTISESWRAATSRSEGRTISPEEWNEKYRKTDAEYLAEKPTRVYKNGNIMVMSYPDESNSKYHTSTWEEALMRDIDDLQSIYPVTSLVIRISDKRTLKAGGEGAYGATARGGDMMWLRGDALMPFKSRQENMMPVSNVIGIREYILTHEWGHLMDKKEFGGISGELERENVVTALLSQTHGEQVGTKWMSNYGNSDPAEAYAEAFTEYVVSKKIGVSPNNPLVTTMAKEFGWGKPWKKSK